MTRENRSEILDEPDVSDDLVSRAYRDLAGIHRWLGDTRLICRAIRRDPLPVRRILDVGCATGLVLEDLRRKLGVEAIGVDLAPRPSIASSVEILQADAVRDRLPRADVAFSMYMGHHLPEDDLERLIVNVGRFCRRFILLDVVRHPLPLAFFRFLLAPFLSPITAVDGERSIRRSYTPGELRSIAASALAGTPGQFQHWVAPFYSCQIIDISYGGRSSAITRAEEAGSLSSLTTT